MGICHAACKPQRCASCVREHSLPQSVAEHGHRIYSAVKFHAKHQGEKALILKRDGQCILIHIKKQAPKPPNHDPEKSLCDSVLIVLKSLLVLLNLVLFPPLVRVSDLLMINTCREFPPVPLSHIENDGADFCPSFPHLFVLLSHPCFLPSQCSFLRGIKRKKIRYNPSTIPQ